ncbi:hypothetical protein O6H91_15G030000 [Diphasiastrum complanatum]|uniref:Uncharacterized protein n=1 Tax=Diphasiastrum complanatum TaxID=34168 RepID=A0ACC2BHU8_DIPCM|nr:hypothetical protein O6H91_15G030000 [Diphasiastrum complanatum]
MPSSAFNRTISTRMRSWSIPSFQRRVSQVFCNALWYFQPHHQHAILPALKRPSAGLIYLSFHHLSFQHGHQQERTREDTDNCGCQGNAGLLVHRPIHRFLAHQM